MIEAKRKTKQQITLAWARRQHKPLVLYIISLLILAILPIMVFISLIAPQLSKGLVLLQSINLTSTLELLVPENLKLFIHEHLPGLAAYPIIDNIISEITENVSQLISVFGSIINTAELWRRAVGLLGGTMSLIWALFLFLAFTILFTLYAREARTLARRILKLPFAVLIRFTNTIYQALRAVMLGIVLVAIIQGTLCALAFFVCGVESPVFWGFLATMTAPIPVVGTMLVWGPLAVLLWMQGSHIAAVGLVIFCAVVVSGVDNFCRPVFLQKGINAPIFVLMLAMLCGLNVFGTLGLILGPLLLSIILQLICEAQLADQKKEVS